ncbi:phage Gp37/Gp68 family protein [Methylophilus sp. QUAN]|uniref:phage Gp37/Gp68 family protein n=1 Tax=Methylophilus sp. QUAN TaxID=2781020 RepID=UPI00188EA7F1|nr:phage Gp37/Gp68 family protein [Methylophilus sp. QUAN]MBF4991104.1 phage Gp37/Gp68 family protein [Methylophilus sp. QUAN]
MSENSKIEWTDSTFNPWMGCTKVSPACDHCYAENLMDNRMHTVQWGKGQPRKRTSAKNWKLPLQWNAEPFYQCTGCGRRGTEAELYETDESICDCFRLMEKTRRRVFCASLADVFDKEVDHEWRADLIKLIEATPNLDWLLLTKRIGNVVSMIEDATDLGRNSMWGHGEWPENVWLGISICNQLEADRDIPKLLAINAKVRFLSVEPLLGPVSLRWLAAWPENAPATAENPYGNGVTNQLDGLRRLDWVIVGGESGPHARPMHPKWAQDLRDQCEAAGVPFLFKQWGEYAPSKLAYDLVTEKILPNVESCEVDDAPEVAWPDGTIAHGRASDHGGKGVFLVRYGKKEAGRVLDGKIYNQFPREAHLEGQ